MPSLKAHAQSQLERTRALYDEFSELFLNHSGDTFQAGLVQLHGREDPRASNLELASRAGIRPGQRVLDAGCGVCGPSIHIAQAYPGLRIDAVTLSPVQVRLGRKKIAEAGLSDRITVHEADYHALPFDDGLFDVVLLLETTGYSPNLKQLYREVARVLQPGGAVYIKDVFQKHGRQTQAERRAQREFDEMWALHRSPTLPRTVELLQHWGFEDIRSRVCEEMTGYRFLGSMLGGKGLRPFELNALGRQFFHRMDTLPAFFGEVFARKPA